MKLMVPVDQEGLKNERLNQLIEEKKVFAQRFDRAIKEEQVKCKHTDQAECDYQSSLSVFPPIRICLHCGMSEDGWGGGYYVLTAKNVSHISRDDLYGLRLGLMIHSHEKTLLAQKKKTLKQLIEKTEGEE